MFYEPINVWKFKNVCFFLILASAQILDPWNRFITEDLDSPDKAKSRSLFAVFQNSVFWKNEPP